MQPRRRDSECVPTAIARKLGDWRVLELDAPNLPRDTVETHPLRIVTGANLPTVCRDWRQKLGDDVFIVSNKVADLPDTMPHVTARGSNDLIGRDVLQTMTFSTPDEYEQLQALNAWTDRADLVLLRHIDEFNQTAGRNLGFRRQGDVRHVLLVNRRLLGLLMGEVLGQSRYDLRVHLDRHQRYEIKRAAADSPS